MRSCLAVGWIWALVSVFNSVALKVMVLLICLFRVCLLVWWMRFVVVIVLLLRVFLYLFKISLSFCILLFVVGLAVCYRCC